MIFRAAKGSKLSDKDAQRYGECIHGYFDEMVGISRDQVLDLARNPNECIHDWFEWDDSVAAEKWRLEQATELLIAIHVPIFDEQGNEVDTTRAFHPVAVDVPDNGNVESVRLYRPIEQIIQIPEQREQIVARAKAELLSWQRRYSQYQELEHLLSILEPLLVNV